MVGLIEREYARLELFGCLESPQHGIEHLVVKRFPHVEFKDLPCLGKASDPLQVFDASVVDDVGLLLLHLPVLFPNQHQEEFIGIPTVLLLERDGAVKIGAVEGGLALVAAG